MGVRTEPIPLHLIRVGHMIRHDNQNKIVDGYSVGNINGVWSMRIDFTDSTNLIIAYPDASVTIEVIRSFY